MSPQNRRLSSIVLSRFDGANKSGSTSVGKKEHASTLDLKDGSETPNAGVGVTTSAHPATKNSKALILTLVHILQLGKMIIWVAPPHFYRAGQVIVLYVGENESIIDLLDMVLGPQFAGA